MVYNNDYLEEPRMPKNEIEDEEHIDRDGRKYYTAKQNDPDMSDKSRFWVGSEGAIFTDAPPITEEDRLEADRLWNLIAQPWTSKGIPDPKLSHEKHKKH